MPTYARDVDGNLIEWDEDLQTWVPAKAGAPLNPPAQLTQEQWDEVAKTGILPGAPPTQAVTTAPSLELEVDEFGMEIPTGPVVSKDIYGNVIPIINPVAPETPSLVETPPYTIAFDPDGNVRVWDATSGTWQIAPVPATYEDWAHQFAQARENPRLVWGEEPPTEAPPVPGMPQPKATPGVVSPQALTDADLLKQGTSSLIQWREENKNAAIPSSYKGVDTPEYEELEALLRSLYPDKYASGLFYEPTVTAKALEDILAQARDDPEGFIRDLYDKGWNADTERLLRLLGASDVDIAEIFGYTTALTEFEEQKEEAAAGQQELMALVNSVWTRGQFANVGAFVDFYQARTDLFIRQIRTGDRTPEKEKLLRILGYSTEQIEDIFVYRYMKVPIDGNEVHVTVGPDGRAFDSRNEWVGTYNRTTRQFTANPQESQWKDAWDAAVLAFNALGHKSKEFFLTTIPNILFGNAPDPTMEKWAVEHYGQDFVDQRKAENVRIRDSYRRIAAAASAEHEEWLLKHPELVPPYEFEVGALGNPSLIKNPAYWAYEFASTAPFTLATMGATILGTLATGNPLVGVLAGMAVATPSQVQDLRDALLAAGAPEDQVDILALLGGTLISGVEVAGDLPMLKSIAPALFKTVRKEIEKEVARGIAERFLVKGAKKFTIVEMTETTEEIVQQAIQNAFVKIYKGDQSLFEGLSEIAVKTFIATAPLAVLGAGASPEVRAAVAQDIRDIKAAAPQIGQAIKDVAVAGKPTFGQPKLGIVPGAMPEGTTPEGKPVGAPITPQEGVARQPYEMTRAELVAEYRRTGNEKGLTNISAIHQAAIKEAAAAGKPISAEVLKDYPALAKTIKAAPVAPAPESAATKGAVEPTVDAKTIAKQLTLTPQHHIGPPYPEPPNAQLGRFRVVNMADTPDMLSLGLNDLEGRQWSITITDASKSNATLTFAREADVGRRLRGLGTRREFATRTTDAPLTVSELRKLAAVVAEMRPNIETLSGVRATVGHPKVEQVFDLRRFREPTVPVGQAKVIPERVTGAVVPPSAPPAQAAGAGQPPVQPPVELGEAPLPPQGSARRRVADRIQMEPAAEGIGEKMRRGFHQAQVKMVDDLYAIKQFTAQAIKGGVQLAINENPYMLGRLLRGVTSKANLFIEQGTFGKKFWKVVNGKAVPNFTGESLESILKHVREPSAWQDFSTYLVARRTVELSGRGITTGVGLADAKAAIRELETQHRNFSDLATRLYKYQDNLLVYGQEMGLLSSELLAKLRQFGDYVPFYRVFNELQAKGFMGKKMADIASPIKRIKGSEREIINPLESIIKNTYVLISAADRNQVGIAMGNLVDQNPEMADVFERVKTPMARVAGVTAKELGVEIEGISAEDAEAVVDIFRPSFFVRGDEVTVLIDGKKAFYKVDPDLRNALLNLDRESMGMLGKLLSLPAKWLRAGATLSPDFMVRNPIRDQWSAMVYSNYGFLPGIDFIRGLAGLISKDADYKLFRASGAEHSMLVSLDRQYLRKTFKEVVRGKKFTDYVKHPLELLQIGSEFGEKATRLGEFKAGIRRGAMPLEAGYSARNVTLDFAQAGTTAHAINQIIAFFNANIRGWTKMTSSFKEHPVRTSARIFLGITLPSILLYFANRDDDRWKEIPQWQKDLFWIIFVGDTIYRIPKPFELGIIFGSMPERFLEWLDTKNPKLMKGALLNMAEAGTPGFLPTAVLPIIENLSNYSFFRGGPIVPTSRSKMPPELQYGRYTTQFSKEVGELLKLSPSKIDNLINGYTGGLGRYATDILDGILKKTGVSPDIPEPSPTLADTPVIKAFVVRSPYGSSGEAVESFYNTLEEFERGEKFLQEMLDLGDQAKFEEFKAKHPELIFIYEFPEDPTKEGIHYSASARYLRKVARELSELTKKADEIYKSPDISSAEKRRLIDEIDKLKTEVSRKALNFLGLGEPQIIQNAINEAVGKLGQVLEQPPTLSLEKPDIFDTKNLHAVFSTALEGVVKADLDKLKGIDPLAYSFAEVKELEKTHDALFAQNIYEYEPDLAEGVSFEEYYNAWQSGAQVDKTLSSLTRIQADLLRQYYSLDTKEEKEKFRKDNPSIEVDPREEWLKANPKENARLAIWGQAKLMTPEALAEVQRLVKELDIPSNALPPFVLPPEYSVKGYAELIKAREEFGDTSWEVKLLLAKDDKLREFMEWAPIDTPIASLELKVKNRALYDQYENMGIPGADGYIYDNKARGEAREKFKKDNPLWVDDLRRVDAFENNGDAATAEAWVERGRIVDQFGSVSAEGKLWLLDHPDIYKWALENKLITDNGSDWVRPILEIKAADRELTDKYEGMGKPDSEFYIADNKQREEARAKLKEENPEFVDNLRRIEALEKGGSDQMVEGWVERGRVADEFPGYSAEEKLWLADHPDVWQWAQANELVSDNGSDWNIPAMRITVKWRKEDAEYDALPSDTDAERLAYLAQNEEYRKDRRRREAYEKGFAETTITESNRKWLDSNINDLTKTLEILKIGGLDQSVVERLLQMLTAVDKLVFPTEAERLELITVTRLVIDELDKNTMLTLTERNVIAAALAESHDFLEDLPFMSRDYLLRTSVPSKVNIVEQYVAYYELPEKGYRQERFLFENPDFAKALNLQLPERVPAVQYDDITDQYRDQFDELEGNATFGSPYYIEDPVARAARDDALMFTTASKTYFGATFITKVLTEFGTAFYRRQAYAEFIPDNYIEDAVNWKRLQAEGKPADWKAQSGTDYWYEDDWYMMEHIDYYREVYVDQQHHDRLDFTRVPTRPVFSAYLGYVAMPDSGTGSTIAKQNYRRSNSNLDYWMVYALCYTPLKTGGSGATPGPHCTASGGTSSSGASSGTTGGTGGVGAPIIP